MVTNFKSLALLGEQRWRQLANEQNAIDFFTISSTNKNGAQFSALFRCLSRFKSFQSYACDWPQHAFLLCSTNQRLEPHYERPVKGDVKFVSRSCPKLHPVLVGLVAAAQHTAAASVRQPLKE